jgi:hypothetical protein
MKVNKKLKAKTTKPKEDGSNIGSPVGGGTWKFVRCIIMMLTQFGEGVQKSGRAGGVVIQSNGIQRQFRAPSLRNTNATGVVRGMFSNFNTAFTSLSQAYQILWASYGYKYIDRLSREKTLSGKSAFTRVNMNLDLTGQSTIDRPPTLAVSAPPLLNMVLTADNSAHSLSLAYTPTASGVGMVFATPPLRSSIFKPSQGKFALIGIFNTPSASPLNLKAMYDNKYGVDAVSGVDSKIFLQVVNVSETGNTSTKGVVNCYIYV